jgi:hypothetical protein
MNFFTATYTVVASSGTYSGTAMSKSPKQAMQDAINKGWEALSAGDAAKGVCSGIAVEGYHMWRGVRKILSKWDI